MTPPIRILIVDDHPAFRTGLRAMLNGSPRLSVVGEAGELNEALEAHRQLAPDITLMDLNLRGASGIDAIRLAREANPGARFIMLSTFDMSEDIHRALEAGAFGYLLKDASRQEIIAAVEAVHTGQRFLPPQVEQRLAERGGRSELSAKEREILGFIVQGRTNKEIGAALSITELTVKGHLKNIFLKMRVTDRTEAAIKAVWEGIVHLNNDTLRR